MSSMSSLTIISKCLSNRVVACLVITIINVNEMASVVKWFSYFQGDAECNSLGGKKVKLAKSKFNLKVIYDKCHTLTSCLVKGVSYFPTLHR